MTHWYDYGLSKKLADKPTPSGRIPDLKSLPPSHGTMPLGRWLKSLPREAFCRPEDLEALRIAEERERMKAEARRATPKRKRA